MPRYARLEVFEIVIHGDIAGFDRPGMLGIAIPDGLALGRGFFVVNNDLGFWRARCFPRSRGRRGVGRRRLTGLGVS